MRAFQVIVEMIVVGEDTNHGDYAPVGVLTNWNVKTTIRKFEIHSDIHLFLPTF